MVNLEKNFLRFLFARMNSFVSAKGASRLPPRPFTHELTVKILLPRVDQDLGAVKMPLQ